MGRESVDITVHARVSRHNSEQDERDDARWAELVAEIERLVERYEDIGAWT